jgi:hypothetical protein
MNDVYIPPRRKFLNEHLIYDASQLSEIEGDNYLYYVRLTTEFLHPAFDRWVLGNNQEQPEKDPQIRNACRQQCKIPSFIKDDINSGKAKLVLDYSTEGYWDIDWQWITKIFEVNEDRIIWLTSLYNFADCRKEVDDEIYHISIDKTSAEVRYNPLWERIIVTMLPDHVKDIEKQLNLIDSLHKRPLMAITYNRRTHDHRVALLSKLLYHNELDNMIWSWGGVTGEPLFNNGNDFAQHAERQQRIQQITPRVNVFISPKYNDSVKKILQTPEHSYNEDISVNKAFDMNYSHIHDTYYQVITETLYEQPGIFLSEKSYKPFLSCQPFILCGQHHTIDVIRQQGYDVYDKWINHEYDIIIEDRERMSVFMEEITRLNSLSHEEWTKMLKEMLPTIKKNLKHLMDSNDKKDILSFNFSEPQSMPQRLIDILT